MIYKFEWHSNDLLVTFNGKLTYKDIVSADNKLFSDYRFDDMNFVIYDFSKVDALVMTDGDNKQTVAINLTASNYKRKLKMAFISNNPQIKEVILKFILLMHQGERDLKIFNNLGDAFEWV